MRTACLAMATFLNLASTAASAATEAPPRALRQVAENAPAIMIPAHTANLMKQELDRHVLFVEIDPFTDRASTLRLDAHVPYLTMLAPASFSEGFVGRMDQALMDKGLRWTDGVVLVSRSPFTAMQAAELLREHGYALLFVVTFP